jgi:hypothetical protein
VLDFVRALRMPAVATLHTVLSKPSVSQRRVLTELIGATAATVVMSGTAASLLTRTYDIEPPRLKIVPHGVPHLPARPLRRPASLQSPYVSRKVTQRYVDRRRSDLVLAPEHRAHCAGKFAGAKRFRERQRRPGRKRTRLVSRHEQHG